MFVLLCCPDTHTQNMLARFAKITVAVALSAMFTVSLAQLTICLWQSLDHAHDVNEWLDQSGLGQYKALFRNRGECLKNRSGAARSAVALT